MKPKLFITIGLPGCGKSTWCKQNLNHYNMFEEILSSDEYRGRLIGDVNDQSKNAEIFKALHTDMIFKLKEGKSICIDATNITRKSRAAIINLVKLNNIDCEIVGVLFEVEESIIREQNKLRERVVPEYVIDRQLRNFEIPFIGEGFDYIDKVFRKKNKLIPYNDIVEQMKGFNQNNPNHTLDLYNHCLETYNKVFKNIVGNNNNLELLIASAIHDIGKLYTQQYDEEKKLCHYIGHENYGAYKSLFVDYSPMILDIEKVAFYINYHMEPFRLKDAKESTKDKYINQFGEEWNNILLIHEADLLAK